MFFSDWAGILRVLAVGVPAYVSLIVLLRLAGKRTLSKFNAFDFIVTVAFGSSLSAALLNQDLALAEVVAAFAVLVLLQFAITWSSVRSDRIDGWVKAKPRLLYHRGAFLMDSMLRERVTKAEVQSAAREQGYAGLDRVDSVVLETDGSISVITAAPGVSLDPHSDALS
jgi:uncharacterized membrane protein YcaP (DUF421 family)